MKTVSRPNRPRDANQLAKLTLDLLTGDKQEQDPSAGKSIAAVERGRAGGKVGGKTRADSLPQDARKAIAAKAAKTRWGTESS